MLTVKVKEQAQSTIETVSRGLQDGQCACLPEMLRIVHSLSAKVRDLAIHEMAELIKNDTVVLEKVISAANKIGYNPSGIPINSVGEAIQVIGFDRVRSLTLSLILLENSNTWQYSEERREATMRSLAAGVMAEQFAKQSGRVNGELAFLCGALRGFGRIVLSTYMVEELREADRLAHELPSDEAYRRVFGLTPLELSHHLMEAAHLSPDLLKTLQKYRPEEHKKELMTPDRRLTGMADFAYELSTASIEGTLNEEQFRKTVDVLKSRYRDVVRPDPDELSDLFVETRRHLRILTSQSGQSGITLNALRCLKSRAEGTNPPMVPGEKPERPAGVDAADTLVKDEEVPVEGGTDEEALTEEERTTRIWEEGIERMRRFMANGRAMRGPVLVDLLKTVRHGFGAEESWAFLEKRPGVFGYAEGMGPDGGVLARVDAVVAQEERSVFGLCLRREESIFIRDTADKTVRAYLPDWYKRTVDLRSFVLLCLRKENGVAGLLYVGWRAPGQKQIQSQHAALIRRLLNLFASMG